MRPTLLLLLLLCACGPPSGPVAQPAIDDMQTHPTATGKDWQLAGVFRSLDGKWKGEFHVYVDTRGQGDGPADPTELDPAVWRAAPYRRTATLQVEQHYTSESDFFQRVVIRDTMPDGKLVVSQGVNKVQDGRLWCVVRKPDDLVIHPGVLTSFHTITWRRNRKEPKAIEYFRETVNADSYSIVGWGKYGEDDPAKAPRMFFEARYARVK